MNNNPLVSVIIIFLNEERFLKEAVESVLAQTYDNWELLLVDDGSTDDSPKMAREFVSKYTGKIRYLTHPGHENLGMSASRNLGVHHAVGHYISYLDGDDVWLPHKLERQVALLKQHPEAVMVYGPLKLWYSWTGDPKDQDRDILYGLQAPRFTLQGNRLIKSPELLAMFVRHDQLIPAGIMIERKAIEKAGGYENRFRGNYEDAVLIAKVCLKSTVFVSEECWYLYRQHPESCTAVAEKTGQNPGTHTIFLNWIEEFLRKEKATDRKVWQALRAARWALQHPRLHKLPKKGRYYLRRIKEKTLSLLGRT